jgi:hypothetical protein
MSVQPLSDGSHMPQQMISRAASVGPKQPATYDKALCAKARGEALKKQREAMNVAPPFLAADAPSRTREKRS